MDPLAELVRCFPLHEQDNVFVTLVISVQYQVCMGSCAAVSQISQLMHGAQTCEKQ